MECLTRFLIRGSGNIRGAPKPKPRQRRTVKPTPAPRKPVVKQSNSDSSTIVNTFSAPLSVDANYDDNNIVKKCRSKTVGESEDADVPHEVSNKTRSCTPNIPSVDSINDVDSVFVVKINDNLTTSSSNVHVTYEESNDNDLCLDDRTVLNHDDVNETTEKVIPRLSVDFPLLFKSRNLKVERSLSHDGVTLSPPTEKPIRRKRSKSLDSVLQPTVDDIHSYENVDFSSDVMVADLTHVKSKNIQSSDKDNTKQTCYENIVLKNEKHFVESLEDCIISVPNKEELVVHEGDSDISDVIYNNSSEQFLSNPTEKRHKPVPIVPYMGLRLNVKGFHHRVDSPDNLSSKEVKNHMTDKSCVSRKLFKDKSFETQDEQIVVSDHSADDGLYEAPPSNKVVPSSVDNLYEAPSSNKVVSPDVGDLYEAPLGSIVEASTVDDFYDCPKSTKSDYPTQPSVSDMLYSSPKSVPNNRFSNAESEEKSDRSSTNSSNSSSRFSIASNSPRDRDSSGSYYNVLPNTSNYSVPSNETNIDHKMHDEKLDIPDSPGNKQQKTKPPYENIPPPIDNRSITAYEEMNCSTKERSESAYMSIDISTSHKHKEGNYELVDNKPANGETQISEFVSADIFLLLLFN